MTLVPPSGTPHRRPPFRLLVLVLGAACLVVPGAAFAQSTGKIAGSVVDRKTGRALAFVNVAVPEARTGALSDSKGDFLIGNIPPGTYTVRAQFTGYGAETAAGVVVEAGRTATLRIQMTEVVVSTEKEVVVTGTRPLVDTKTGGTIRTVRSEDIANQGLQTIAEVVAQQAGVSNEENVLRVRGGRGDEVTIFVDGVAFRDPISGESTAGKLSARSVAELTLVSSGFSARYGQALSGVVDVRLKDGGPKFEGGLSAQAGNHWTQFYEAQLSGPDPISGALRNMGLDLPGEAAVFFNLSADFSNTYLPSIQDIPGRPRLRSGYEDNFLGWKYTYSPNFFMPFQENVWRGIAKWTWKPENEWKIGLAYNKNIAFDQGFNRRPFSDIAGQSLSYPWNFHDRLTHFATVTADANTFALDFTKTTGTTGFHQLQLSRAFSGQEVAVDGKKWFDYVQPDDPGLPFGQNRPYFVDSGDYNEWDFARSVSWTVDYRRAKNFGRVHRAEFGIQHSFQEVQYTTIINPWVFDPDGLGEDHDLWLVHPGQGAAYAQDRLEYEGFVVEGGVRLDWFVPGSELEAALADTSNKNILPSTPGEFEEDTGSIFGKRVKAVMSPRIAVSHPIRGQDKLFFNFGQFTQFPSYYYIYSKLTSVASASYPNLGNPNLNPEKSVQFEVGGEHLFRPDLAGKISLFQKDIYDYPTAVPVQRLEGEDISDFLLYLNLDFARSRGFEVEFEKSRRKYWSYRANYTYSVAKGKQSDPNASSIIIESGGNASERNLGEGSLSWNRPHRFNFAADFRTPGTGDDRPQVFGVTMPRGFGVNLSGTMQSGRAYTPEDVEENAIGASYTKNGPFEVLLNLRLSKDFPMGQETLRLFLTGENILDWEVARRVDQSTGKLPEVGVGQYQDPDEFTMNSVILNPSYEGPPMRWRLGLDYDF
jgi:outer membrane receptor protein involved in Fe transport